MPFLTLPLSPGGPILEVFVGVSAPREDALRLARQPVPELLVARALIDTGASSTVLDPLLLTQLELSPRGTVLIHTPSTAGRAHLANQFDVRLLFRFSGVDFGISAIPVIEAHLSSQGFTVLIGRDVLANGIFTYNGPSGIFSLGF